VCPQLRVGTVLGSVRVAKEACAWRQSGLETGLQGGKGEVAAVHSERFLFFLAAGRDSRGRDSDRSAGKKGLRMVEGR